MATASAFVSSVRDGATLGWLRGFDSHLHEVWKAAAPNSPLATLEKPNVWSCLDSARDRFERPIVVAGDLARHLVVFDGLDGSELLAMDCPGNVVRIQIDWTSAADLTAYVACWDYGVSDVRAAGGLLALRIHTNNNKAVSFSRRWLSKEPVHDAAVTRGVAFVHVHSFPEEPYMAGLDLASGDQLWRIDRQLWSLVRDEDAFYCRSGHSLVSIDVTGSQLWETPGGVGWHVAVAGPRLIGGGLADTLRALDGATGAALWQQSFTNSFIEQVTDYLPSGQPDLLVVRYSTPTTTLGPVAWHLAGVDSTNGSIVWTTTLPTTQYWSITVDAIDGSEYWIGTLGIKQYPQIQKFDVENGSLIKATPLPDETVQLVVTDNRGRGGYHSGVPYLTG